YEAAPRAIEGPLGWARAMGDEPDLARLTGGLGETWEIAKNTYKPYPAGIVFHAVIDASAGARRSAGSQRTRCKGQHSPLCGLRLAAGHGRRDGIRGGHRIQT